MDLSRRKLLGFYINMVLYKFKRRHAEHALDFGNSNFRFKITRIKSCSYYELKRKTNISTCHVEKCSGFLTITNQFHKFNFCNAKLTL
jgi:hypothetical protein